jgi:hypothetical protein
MTSQLVEAQEKHAKADKECLAMRDGLKSLKEVWGREVRGLKDEMRQGEDKWRAERDEAVSGRSFMIIGDIVEKAFYSESC